MATTRTYQNMLNEYLPNEMLFAEVIKRDWYLSNVTIDNSWKDGPLVVPFKSASASSIAFGELTDSTDISQSQFVRGYVPAAKEVWASLQVFHRDIMDHSGKIPESTFLKILPNEIDALMDKMKQAVSTQLLVGAHFAKFVTNGTVGGTIEVDHIDRFDLGQKLQIDDDDSAPLTVYVIGIILDTNTITVSLTRGGLAADVSAYTSGQNAKCYHPGAINNAFTPLVGGLLSAANGGTTTLHGQLKTSSPWLQASNFSGSLMTASNVLSTIFDAYSTMRAKGKGNASTVVMSYKHYGSVLKALETQKGAFYQTKQPKTNVYGWSEVEIGTVKGDLKVVGVLEMDNDTMLLLDLKSLIFYTNGGFQKRKGPNGNEYFEVRNATTGYSYITDLCLFGESAILNPSNNGVIFGINY